MKFQLLTLLSAICASPIETETKDKRAWMTSSKSFYSLPKLVSKFKIVTATENALRFRYRLRFSQDGTLINLQSYPDTNGVVRFFTTDVTEQWNMAGSDYTLDRIIPGSGVWQDEKSFYPTCVMGGYVNTFAYAGTFTFTCDMKR